MNRVLATLAVAGSCTGLLASGATQATAEDIPMGPGIYHLVCGPSVDIVQRTGASIYRTSTLTDDSGAVIGDQTEVIETKNGTFKASGNNGSSWQIVAAAGKDAPGTIYRHWKDSEGTHTTLNHDWVLRNGNVTLTLKSQTSTLDGEVVAYTNEGDCTSIGG